MTSRIRAILFDLDGVLTDTAEYHYQAWQWLADAEGIPFDRTMNEQLRGVSRRESLAIMLAGRPIDEPTAREWMDRKNRRYQESLHNVSPADLLPGVAELLAEIRGAGLLSAVVSASHNASTVLDRLGITGDFDVIVAGPEADAGPGMNRAKPAPDLFLLAAKRLGVPPAACLVVEDAASGIEGARAAGMATVGIGPEERVAAADMGLPNLEGVSLATLLRAALWAVSDITFQPERQNHWETVLANGNGMLGTRAGFEERYPDDMPATLIHGLWDSAPVVYEELANGFNWTAVDLWIDGEPFRMDRGRVSDYSRTLDLRTGELRRSLRWTTGGGKTVELRFERFASLADPHVLAQRVVVTPLDGAMDVRLRGRLDGHVENHGALHWRAFEQGTQGDMVYLTGFTRGTGKQLAQAMHLTARGATVERAYADIPNSPGWNLRTRLETNQSFTAEKLVSLYTNRQSVSPVTTALDRAQQAAAAGYDTLAAANRDAWRAFWMDCDAVIEGDDEAQLAVRHALFHLRIAAPTGDERVSIGARSLTGFGYRGHAFWDTETFVLPFFIYCQPALARNLLMYRWHTLAGARRKAQAGGFVGAQFAWESAETGDEVTPRWVPGPQGEELVRIWCGDIELHITADIAFALWQYWTVTGDDAFMAAYGAPIILETARFWESRVEPNRPAPGQYSISDVIGPDEYHEHVDNNMFTNAMVRWHLRAAARALDWLEGHDAEQAASLREQFELSSERLAKWQEIADNLVILYDPQTKLYEQFAGFFQLKEVDWPAFKGRTKSLQAILGIEGANRHQVLKQPDVLLYLTLFRNEHSRQEFEANWDYYAPRTDHSYGSSLGPAIHAWAACELGKRDEAYEHFMRAARADIGDVRGNSNEGIHIASSGGLWQALVFGFGGLHLTEAGYETRPCLPRHWTRLAFKFFLRGEQHSVDLRAGEDVQ